MKIKFLIPVTSDYSQKKKDIEAYLAPIISQDTEIVFQQIEQGYESIETEHHGLVNGVQVLKNVQEDQDNYDGIYINCFDDPGVSACREVMDIPVIGPYQPSICSALLLSDRIGVITTDNAGILSEEKKAQTLGILDRIKIITPVSLSVDDIRNAQDKLVDKLYVICKDMYENHQITSVCLGCAAMFYVLDKLNARLEENKIYVNVIEPISNGILTLEKIIILKQTNRVKIL